VVLAAGGLSTTGWWCGEEGYPMSEGDGRRRTFARLGERIYTTGQVANLCGVAMRTVSNWFDKHKLGYRIPDSRDRRIPAATLVVFLREHDMHEAAERVLVEAAVVLAGVPEPLRRALSDVTAGEALLEATDLYHLGQLVGAQVPRAVVLDSSLGTSEAISVARRLAALTRTLVLLGEDGAGEGMARASGVRYLRHPVNAAVLAGACGLLPEVPGNGLTHGA
jgi:transcriptional regulator of aromatic amino acid metabolism